MRTFEILPEYLKTSEGKRVKDYRDWGIPLGRRFRALKLWFVIRSFGVSGLQEKVRHHIELAQETAKKIQADSDFELLAPVPLNVICFRYCPASETDADVVNRLNARLLEEVNHTASST